MLAVSHTYNVARLVDGVRDNPNELTVGRANDGRVVLGLCDRDEGNTELWITVSEDELLAAIALSKVSSWAE